MVNDISQYSMVDDRVDNRMDERAWWMTAVRTSLKMTNQYRIVDDIKGDNIVVDSRKDNMVDMNRYSMFHDSKADIMVDDISQYCIIEDSRADNMVDDSSKYGMVDVRSKYSIMQDRE